jgi:hypothetical protein
VPTGGRHVAAILDGANITLQGGGDLLLSAVYEGEYLATTRATPLDLSEVGIGASASINAMAQLVQAEIQDADIDGAGAGSNISVLAEADHFAGRRHGRRDPGRQPAGRGGAQLQRPAHGGAHACHDRLDTSEITGNLTIDADHQADSIRSPTPTAAWAAP